MLPRAEDLLTDPTPTEWTERNASGYDDPDDPWNDPDLLDRTTAFLVGYAQDGPAVEFAVGTGRVALPLAHRGLEVHGIDKYQPMLDKLARRDAADLVKHRQGVMTEAVVGQHFSLVYLVFNTITNLLTQDAQVQCFRNAAAHLRPGGHFVIECYIPPLRSNPPGAAAAVFDVSTEHVGIDTMDLATQRAVSHHFIRNDDGTYRFSPGKFRMVWPSELDLMARLAGLSLVERVADWDHSPFTSESASAISVWRKP